MPINQENQEKDGRWKKGKSGNPSGRPNDAHLRKLLRDLFGEDGKELIYILIAQMYGVDINNTGIDNKINQLLPAIEKQDWRKRLLEIDKRLQTDNAKWLLDRMFGKAIQNINAEVDVKTLNVNIDLPSELSTDDF
jgi:hypothetical protein